MDIPYYLKKLQVVGCAILENYNILQIAFRKWANSQWMTAFYLWYCRRMFSFIFGFDRIPYIVKHICQPYIFFFYIHNVIHIGWWDLPIVSLLPTVPLVSLLTQLYIQSGEQWGPGGVYPCPWWERLSNVLKFGNFLGKDSRHGHLETNLTPTP